MLRYDFSSAAEETEPRLLEEGNDACKEKKINSKIKISLIGLRYINTKCETYKRCYAHQLSHLRSSVATGSAAK